MGKLSKDNVLVISDTHLPFERADYLDFCLDIQKRCHCKKVVHIGDLVDNHAISYHEHDPNGQSPIDEMKEADNHLKDWFKAFPKLHLCIGNHGSMVDRKGRTVGLPARVFQPFRKIWNLPSGWIDGFEFQIDGVRYIHGTGYSGKYSHIQLAYDSRQSAVMGHTHSTAGVEWLANAKDCIFGMNVGSGIDRKRYAFAYGKDARRKPIISCGIVTDKGKYAQVFPANL